MTALARSTAPPLLLDLPHRNFATLGRDEAARLAVLLRPLPWLDGLVTAAVIAPEEPSDWLDHIWADGALEKLTLSQTSDVTSMVEDHFCHVVDMLFERPELYHPFLGTPSDELEAAAQWAAGFRFGIRLWPEPWRPLIDDEGARSMLAVIFSLEREQDLMAAAESPFRDIPADRREQMRHEALAMLPSVVPALNGLSVDLDAFGSMAGEGAQPHTRTSPKIGRNEPCPCGSGKKYKKCCLAEAERNSG